MRARVEGQGEGGARVGYSGEEGDNNNNNNDFFW